MSDNTAVIKRIFVKSLLNELPEDEAEIVIHRVDMDDSLQPLFDEALNEVLENGLVFGTHPKPVGTATKANVRIAAPYSSSTRKRHLADRQLSPPQNDSQQPNNDFQEPDNNFQEPDMAKKKTTKKTYSQDARQEAIRLLTKEKLSAATVAKQLGCSYGTIISWQKKEQEAAATAQPKASPKATPEAPTEVTMNPSPKSELRKLLPEVDFDTFVRNFWNEGTRAVDVLLLPPELSSRVVNYVNESLKYAFETLR